MPRPVIIATPLFSCYSIIANEQMEQHEKRARTQQKPTYTWKALSSTSGPSLSRIGTFLANTDTPGGWQTPAVLIPTVGGAVPHLTADIWTSATFAKVFISVKYDDLRNLAASKRDVHWCLNQDEENVFIVTTMRDSSMAKPDRNLVTDEMRLQADCNIIDLQLQPNLWACPEDAVPETTGSNKNSLAVDRSGLWASISASRKRLACVVGRDDKSASASVKKSTLALQNVGGYYVDVGKREVVLGLVRELDSALPRVVAAGTAGPRDVLDLIAAGYDLVETNYPQYLAKVGYASVFWIEESSSSEWGAATKIDARSPGFLVDTRPLVASCTCFACQNHTRAYVRHLTETREMLGETLLFVHNLAMMLRLVETARNKLRGGTFAAWFEQWQSVCQE